MQPRPRSSVPSGSRMSDSVHDPDYLRRVSEAFTDDITWLGIGKRLLEETIPTLNAQARSLGSSVGWFWTVYSASTVVATSAFSEGGVTVNWLLVAPVFSTLIGYLLAVAAQSPVRDKVDLRSVEDIRRAVDRSVTRKVRLIRACIVVLMITASLIGTGLAVQLV